MNRFLFICALGTCTLIHTTNHPAAFATFTHTTNHTAHAPEPDHRFTLPSFLALTYSINRAKCDPIITSYITNLAGKTIAPVDFVIAVGFALGNYGGKPIPEEKKPHMRLKLVKAIFTEPHAIEIIKKEFELCGEPCE